MLTLGEGGLWTLRGLVPLPRSRIVRELHGLPETLARSGSLELKFALTKKEIRRTQRMRYRVFFEQGGAIADPLSRAQRRDRCAFDRICDHIIVIDHDATSRFGRRKPRVVGAYRLLRQEALRPGAQFYSAGEYAIAPLLARHADKRFLELGRSCVLPEYRSRRVLELLWRGVWTYVRHHRIDVMIGCASLPGVDPAAHATALAVLGRHAATGDEWSVRALPHRRADVDLPDARANDMRRALVGLPPLVKGYLRLGARFGADAVVDRAFGTTDVFVVMPVADIDARYIEHFTGAAMEAAAA